MNKTKVNKIKTKLKHDNLSNNKIDMVAALYETEKKANISFANVSAVMLIFYIVFLVLTANGIFIANKTLGIISLSIAIGFHLIISVVCYALKGQSKWLKYFMFSLLIISIALVCIVSGYEFWLILSIPVLLSVNYYRSGQTILVSIIVEVVLAISVLCGAYVSIDSGWIDVNYAGNFVGQTLSISSDISDVVLGSSAFSKSVYIKNQYIYCFIPNAFVILLLAIIGVQSTKHGKRMLIEESEFLVAKTKAEKEAAESRTQIMISQIQPHFIYNTLNSIYYLCDKEPETAKKAIAEFSDYLRTNLNFMDKRAYVSFEQELGHISKYLSLEKMRFEDELNVLYDIQCTSFKVPALAIQPLVENAVKHGICKKQGGGTVRIWSKDALTHYEIGIADDGVGFDINKPFDDNRRHIGLENTKNRLEDMCKADIEITSEIGVGTTIIIKIPKENYYEDTGSR